MITFNRNWHISELSLIVKPEGEPIFSDLAPIVKMDDESAGPFVVVTQPCKENSAGISIDCDEWPHIKKAIDRMIKMCTDTNDPVA